jgi:hypothetical protein
MKKTNIFFLATLFAALNVNVANAQSGVCGDNLAWTLSGDANNKTLTISGTGAMTDWTPNEWGYSSDNPWFQYYGQIKNVVIEDGVTTIGNCAFAMLIYVTSVSIPESVTSIGSDAFHDCLALPSVTIPATVTEIAETAFQRCQSLTSVNIPNSITSISGGVFSDCISLTSVSIPDNVISIGSGAFSRCTSLTSIIIPDKVTTIGGYAFSNCTSLASIDIPNGATFSGYSVFMGCTALTSVTLPDALEVIPISTFQSCNALTSIHIPNSVKTINGGAFMFTGLTSVIIPDAVHTIQSGAFDYCTALRKVTLGSGLTYIGDKAFGRSPLDTLVSLAAIPPTLGSAQVFHYTQDGVDYGAAANIPVYVPCNTTAYSEAANWDYFSNFIASGSSLDATITQVGTSLIANQPGASYQWLDCNNGHSPIAGATSQTFTPLTASGNYAVEITLGACTEVSECINFTASGIEHWQANEISIYPNPVMDELKIVNVACEINSVEIVDISGKSIVNLPSKIANKIDVSALSAGVYLIKINTGKGVTMERFIKK